jgi:hypothetical protein
MYIACLVGPVDIFIGKGFSTCEEGWETLVCIDTLFDISLDIIC